jgi:hypothetical protein
MNIKLIEDYQFLFIRNSMNSVRPSPRFCFQITFIFQIELFNLFSTF